MIDCKSVQVLFQVEGPGWNNEGCPNCFGLDSLVGYLTAYYILGAILFPGDIVSEPDSYICAAREPLSFVLLCLLWLLTISMLLSYDFYLSFLSKLIIHFNFDKNNSGLPLVLITQLFRS